MYSFKIISLVVLLKNNIRNNMCKSNRPSGFFSFFENLRFLVLPPPPREAYKSLVCADFDRYYSD